MASIISASSRKSKSTIRSQALSGLSSLIPLRKHKRQKRVTDRLSVSELLNNRLELSIEYFNNTHLLRPTADPLYSLYRLYSFLVLDWPEEIKFEVSHFWNNHRWQLSKIPDPKDKDPERYAILAGIVHILVLVFNYWIEIGPPRYYVSGYHNLDALITKPKVYETAPRWSERVPSLDKTLRLPSRDGTMVSDEDAYKCASEILLKWNILREDPLEAFKYRRRRPVPPDPSSLV
ncbi:hypothetical protein ABW19_dt0205931 [Dactylella cylindrospora]|nr:hypothetical protein ABW19_dt0205931 [Dactylella cylindrospora]